MSGTVIRLEWRIAPRPDGRGGHVRIDISAPTALTPDELERLAVIDRIANSLAGALRARHAPEQEGTP